MLEGYCDQSPAWTRRLASAAGAALIAGSCHYLLDESPSIVAGTMQDLQDCDSALATVAECLDLTPQGTVDQAGSFATILEKYSATGA